MLTHISKTLLRSTRNQYFTLVRSSDVSLASVNGLIKRVQWFQSCISLEVDVAFEPPRRCLGRLVFDETASRHSEDAVQLLQRTLLRLGHEQEDHAERDHV